MASHSLEDARKVQFEFELMQNITDKYGKPTEFDKYVDQKTGQIYLNQLSNVLSAGIWGLVMAKARATFSFVDLID